MYRLSLLEIMSELKILKSKGQVKERDTHRVLRQSKIDIFMDKNLRYYGSVVNLAM